MLDACNAPACHRNGDSRILHNAAISDRQRTLPIARLPMEADNDHADNKSDTYLPLALSCGTGLASVDAAQEAAASAVADWHREAQDGKQRQFSIYMNRKRYVVPEGGLKSVPTVPFTKQQGLVTLTRNAIRKSIGDPATAVSLPSPGESSNWMHRQHLGRIWMHALL